MPVEISEAEYVEIGRQFLEVALNSFSFTTSPEFAAKPGGTPKQCSKGFSCKAACISKLRECLAPLSGQAKTYAGWLELQIKAGAKLSDPHKADADAMGLTKQAKSPKKTTPKTPKAVDPNSVSSFEKKSLAVKLDAEQEKALKGWADYFETIKDDDSIDSEVRARAKNASGLAGDIQFYAKMPSYADGYRALVDKNGVTQSAAMTSVKSSNKGDSLYVDFLATAPWNVAGSDPRRTKGAGTAMIKELVEESIKQGMEGRVSLFAMQDAVPFYRKLGFTGSYDDMNLTPQAAHKLLYG